MESEEEILKSLLPVARYLVRSPRIRRSTPAGYDIRPGEKVLIAVNSLYDEFIVKAITYAIREAGAKVDIVIYDMGPDRELDYIDELNCFIHNWKNIEEENPARMWLGRKKWVESFAEEHGYDLLLHTTGGPLPPLKSEKKLNERRSSHSNPGVSYAYEGIPWITRHIFHAAKFPYELWDQINRKTWDTIWLNAPGGRGRVTDPEGTDISWTFWEEYFDPERYKRTKSIPMFQREPSFGHLYGRPTPPYRLKEDAEGVISGTTNHIGRPYPNMKAYVENSQVVRIEGGGPYGDLVRNLQKDTKGVKYPEYPEKGFLYWWELAIGTHPKMARQINSFMLSGAGTLYERLRSGIIHMGFGTPINSSSEEFARGKGLIYGHVHIHLLFPTFEITTKHGNIIKIIDQGHLTALDDPEIVDLASKFGDPKELLKEDFIPPIPGINIPGDYQKDYAVDPFSYIKNYHASTGKTSV